MKHFCIIANSQKEESKELAEKIYFFLMENGGECQILDSARGDETASPLGAAGFTDVSKLKEDVECAIVLGGDGTIIQAARELAPFHIPILGVNLGMLGFLAEIEKENLEPALFKLLKEEPELEERMMLNGKVTCDKRPYYDSYALNDIVISRSGYSRIITINVYLDGSFTQSYPGDGLIVATPTGSTAYSLSAGGPVIVPDAKVMVITPICPHTLGARSIVASADSTIEIEIAQSKKSQKEEAIVSFDGNEELELTTGDRIEIRRAKETACFVKGGGKSFLEVLRSKMGAKRQEG